MDNMNDNTCTDSAQFSDDRDPDMNEQQENSDAAQTSAAFEEKAKKVLHVVEGILDSNDNIRAVCKKLKREVLLDDDDDDDDEKTTFMKVGKKIIAYYSDRAGVSGGLSGLPSMIPGIGSIVGLVGASAADIVFMLKYELEMTLCLCHLIGFDIDDPYHRQLAFTLATVSSYDILSNHDEAAESRNIVGSAFWDYSMRQLSKHLITVIAGLLWLNVSKGMVKAIPVLGILVGASFNKVMTKRAGLCCLDALWIRRHLPEKVHEPENDVIYDAEILD